MGADNEPQLKELEHSWKSVLAIWVLMFVKHYAPLVSGVAIWHIPYIPEGVFVHACLLVCVFIVFVYAFIGVRFHAGFALPYTVHVWL